MMDVEIVPDYVHRPCGIAFGDGLHESQQIRFLPGSATVAKNLSRPRIEGGQQSPSPVAPILELETAGFATTGTLGRISTLQRLNP
jgi:hypothetical protein